MTRSDIQARAATRTSNAAAVASFARGMSRWESATAVAVASERVAGQWYTYDLTTHSCSCPAAAYRGRCKHADTAEAFAAAAEATRPAGPLVVDWTAPFEADPLAASGPDMDLEDPAYRPAPAPDDVPPALERNARTGGWWAPDWRERLGYQPGASRWPREI
jgi:hypothetical protein